MKKRLIAGFLLILILSGCAGRETAPKQGDFTFELPEGYSLSNITEENCAILRDDDSAVIGGIEVTELKHRDLTDNESKNILLYLQNDFHKTNNIEFLAQHWGDQNPIVCITLTKLSDDTDEKSHFFHVFFEKDSCVYHMWLDLDVIDAEVADQFLAITSTD